MKNILLSLIDRFINYKKRVSASQLIGYGVILLTGPMVLDLLLQSSIEGSFQTAFGNIKTSIEAGGLEWYVIVPAILLIFTGIILHFKQATTSNLTPLEIQSLPKADISNLRNHIFKNLRGNIGDGYFLDLRNLFHAPPENIDMWRNNVIEKLKSVRNTLEQSGKSNPDMQLAIGGVGHVPILIAIGFYLTNRINAIFYCWHRDKRLWVNTEDQTDRGNYFHTKCIKNKENSQKIGVILQCSIPINQEEFLNSSNSDTYYLISLNNIGSGNLFSAHEQQRLCREFGEIYNQIIRPQHPKISHLDITISAQASFILRLGAEFNQNHMPEKIKIWHFENQQYPWFLCLYPHQKYNPIDIKLNANIQNT